MSADCIRADDAERYPIVKDGKIMWNETVNANCSRDSRRAVRSIAIPH